MDIREIFALKERLGGEAVVDINGVKYSLLNGDIMAQASSKDIEEADILDGTEIVVGYGFSYCRSLKSVVIPKSVKFIYSYAFSHCYSLEEVQILNDEVNIHAGAFKDCPQIKRVIIAEKLRYMYGSSFVFDKPEVIHWEYLK